MSNLNRTNLRKEITLIIYNKLELLTECVKFLLEAKSEIKVIDSAGSGDDLLEKVARQKPDVVLFVLSEGNDEASQVMTELIQNETATKALVLSDLNGSLDQSELLKSGASGIVGTHQKDEILIRAIRRISNGEVYFGQELIARILRNGTMETNEGLSKDRTLANQELTNRELDVVRSILQGVNNKEISKRLIISEATVRHHLSSIYSKLYIEDRLGLVIYAYQNNLASRPDCEHSP